MGNRNKMNTKGGRYSAKGVWEKVLRLLGPCDQCIILDAPAGNGLLSENINKRGGTVIAADISTVRSDKIDCIQMDLNMPFPFKNEIFDKIVCVEGIEHIENPNYLLREFSRTLKNKGILILTTPNTNNIRSRLKFLLTGCLFWFDDYAIKRFGHITPIFLYQLKYFCMQRGLNIIGIYFSRNVIWMKILAPLFWIVSILFKTQYNNYGMLAGENIILKLEKNSFS
jgi:SAM-dependent methyltransferase